LEADFSVTCYKGEHALFSTIALAFVGLYVLGFPMFLFLILFKNREHLNNPNSSRHETLSEKYGGLYLQYSPRFWWFETVSITHKMIMTGAMCVVTPGSSSQLLIATVIMLIYMLLVLKTAPFVENSEDLSSFIACFTLTLTYIGGFALISEVDNRDDVKSTYDTDLLAFLLIFINVLCIVIEFLIFIVVDIGGCVGSLVKAQRALKHSDALGETDMFGILPAEARAAVIDVMTIKYCDKGDNIVTQGDVATEFMVIMSGTASVLVDGVEVRTFKKLDMLGENTLVAVQAMPTRGATVKATKDVMLLVLDRNSYRHLVDSSGYEWSLHDRKMTDHARRVTRTYSELDMKREKSSTKVMPIPSPPTKTKEERSQQLREIREKYGAGSEEYKSAAMSVGRVD